MRRSLLLLSILSAWAVLVSLECPSTVWENELSECSLWLYAHKPETANISCVGEGIRFLTAEGISDQYSVSKTIFGLEKISIPIVGSAEEGRLVCRTERFEIATKIQGIKERWVLKESGLMQRTVKVRNVFGKKSRVLVQIIGSKRREMKFDLYPEEAREFVLPGSPTQRCLIVTEFVDINKKFVLECPPVTGKVSLWPVFLIVLILIGYFWWKRQKSKK